MPIRDSLPQAPKPGEPIQSSFLGALRDATDAALEQVRPPKQRTASGTATEQSGAAESGSGGVGISKFTVSTEQTDHLVATDSTLIAKPDHLRGFVRTRVNFGEPQVILPAYSAGGPAPVESTIYAAEVGDVVTGIAGVNWIDLNAIARAWAEDI